MCIIGSGSTCPKELDEKVAELPFQVHCSEIFFLVVTWISPGVPSAVFTRHKNPSWELIKWLLAESPRTSGRSRRALQLIRAECSSNGSWRSHPALAGSSRTPASVAWGARIRESGKKAPDLLNDIFLVSSVSALANVGSAKDFFLRGGGSWCAFPAVLPSS